MSILVYVAAPYTAPTLEEIEANVGAALDAADDLEDEVPGVVAQRPHLYHFAHQRHPRTYEEWMRRCLAMLGTCQAMLRSLGPSPGVKDEEVEAVRLGIPVFNTPHEIKQWLYSRAA